jgi:hypothetical protein
MNSQSVNHATVPTPESPGNKDRRVRVEIGQRGRFEDQEDRDASRLGILFKEVLQQIPGEQAKALVDAYMNGKAIVVAMGQSSGGPGSKTAFQCAIGMYEPGTAILHHEFKVESETESGGQLRHAIVLPCGLVAKKKATAAVPAPDYGIVN